MHWIDLYMNFTAGSIYGVFPVLIISYLIFYILRKIFRIFPEPFIFVGLIFFVYIFTAPSYPRYKFEKNIIAKFNHQSEFKLVNDAKWGAFIEPLTLIKTPRGFFHFVSPATPGGGNSRYIKNGKANSFYSEIYRYEETPITQIVDADCSDKMITISEPVDGVYRTKVFNQKMNDNEEKIYCATDFTPQMQIFYCKFRMLTDVKKVSLEEVIEADKKCSSKPIN